MQSTKKSIIKAVLLAILTVCRIPAHGSTPAIPQDSVEQYARQLVADAEATQNKAMRQKGYALLGELYMRNDDNARAREYLDASWEAWEQMGKRIDSAEGYKTVYRLYNALGILIANSDMDYARATSLFIEGLELALRNNNDHDYAVLAYNLVVLFFVREDTQGQQYAQSLYDNGVQTDDPYMKSLGALAMALMAGVAQDYNAVEQWLDRAEETHDWSDYIMVATLRGVAATGLHHYSDAEREFNRARSMVPGATASEVAYFYHSYSRFLFRRNRLDEARRALVSGIEHSKKCDNHVFTYRLYHSLSQLASLKGDSADALAYFRRYHDEYTRVYSLEQERQIKGLAARYSSAVHKQLMQKAEMEMMIKNRNMVIVLIITLFVAVATLVSVVMYRRKNRLYKRVALQLRESVHTQSRLRGQIEALRNARNDQPQPGTPSLDTEKVDRIFSDLERLMSVDKVFSDPDLTREKVAAMLGTNRTYLSQTLRQRTGKTFTAYVNDFRIDEALRLLADHSLDLPLKAVTSQVGFASPATFYKCFKEKTGMTPALYQQNAGCNPDVRSDK